MFETYSPKLGLKDTEKAIKFIKDNFETALAANLNLQRVSAPLFVRGESGINDNLNGVERIVNFTIKNIPDTRAEVVQSLAKWKRAALKRYGFRVDEGLYTDMNAIRCDDDVDYLHSIYVDQWDWERVISSEERNIDFLKYIVDLIVKTVYDISEKVKAAYPCLDYTLNPDAAYITTQELEDMYPELSPKEREYEFVKAHKTACIMQIGGILNSGIRHDGRAPDYDDWDLNCDILFWQDTIGAPIEISSMGIRVSPEVLDRQLTLANADDRRCLPYHKSLLNGELPLTIGGGIGQSRLCMLMLQCAHIGEVQSSIWPCAVLKEAEKHGVNIL